MSFHKKSCLLSLAFASPCVSFAQSQNEKDISKPKLGELTFFQEENTFYNDVSLSFAKETYKEEYTSGSKYTISYNGNYEKNTISMTEFLSYSFKKNQAFGIELSYGSVNYKYNYDKTSYDFVNNYPTSFSSSNLTANSNGFYNPIFSYKFRIIEQVKKEKPINLDLLAKLSPNLIPAKNISYDINDSKNGTVASGNTSIIAGATLSQKIESFNWLTNANLKYVGETKKTETDNDSTSTSDPFIAFSLAGKGQYYLNSVIGLDIGIFHQYIPEITIKNDKSTSKYVSESRNETKVSLGLNLIAIENKLNLYTELNFYAGNDYNENYYNTKYTIKETKGREFIFGAKFTF
ncbi:hypothetical protein GCL60_02835 [Silvanigrella paludirubra]|uniref:Outer membrane beta-barrel protein n=1 Tax=Silvanigrella paludirubra TaxID=2499159 RepID=A0A6N6VX40_9BACT|nr:hypothetical protein [Silvanigrella paludirubra]KAB8040881.1 hypothetical protein GCL60_02835 [Silvanigrella paludirubra]